VPVLVALAETKMRHESGEDDADGETVRSEKSKVASRDY
jgi:hypothetical protein